MGRLSRIHQVLQCLAVLHMAISVVALNQCIDTASGRICGTSVSYIGRQVRTFLGIPFAEPPVGNLRFRKPEPIKPWTKTLQATTLGPACPQQFKPAYPWADTTSRQDEDCLYLNIWVPPNTNASSKKAVMFWIFSGAFAQGSGGLPVYDGSVLAAEGDVIVVTINFRLSILGFLSTIPPTKEAPGNMGFYDMLEALNWVKKNIQFFGGDSDNLTLFGSSSGGLALGFICTSPLAKGKFQKAILQSGNSAIASSDASAKNAELAKKVALKLGCDIVDSDKMVACFRNQTARKLVTVTKNSHDGLVGFLSIVGDEFMPTEPKVQLLSGTFNDVPIIVGDVMDEGSFEVAGSFKSHYGAFGEKTSSTNKSLGEAIVRKLLKDVPQKELIVKYYLGDVSDADEKTIIEQTEHAVADFLPSCPSQYFAERYSSKGLDVYFYYFNHVPSVTPWAKWLGVAHFDEVAFMFGRPLDQPSGYTPAEKRLSRTMVKMWSNFAKTGAPGDGWQKYSGSDPDPYYKYFTIEQRPNYVPTLRKNCEFYRSIVGFPPPTPSLPVNAPSLPTVSSVLK